jgi:Zn-dependent protease with chaperone function
MIARSTLWGTVQIGEAFHLLSEAQQRAVIAHERGHIHHRHALKRLWWMISFQWKGFFERCEAQELEADQYAAQHGHKEGLVSFLTRWSQPVKADGYPTVEQRLENLSHV